MTDTTPTVGVVGLGAAGSMTLWHLARSGVAVTGFERNRVGDDDAAYGGHTRQFRLGTHDAHDEAHRELAGRALELWREIEADTGETLYIRTGQLGVGPADDPDVTALLANLERSGLAHAVLEPAEVAQRFPAHRLADNELGVLVAEAGVLRSNRAVVATVASAGRHGAEVVTGTRVTAVDLDGDGRVTVRADNTTRTFDHVVVTAGPWAAELFEPMRELVTARAIITGWHRSSTPELTEPRRFPPGFRRASTPAGGFTFLPALDGRGVKIVHWMPLRPEVGDTVGWGPVVDPDLVRDVIPAVSAALTGIDADPSEVEVYLEGFTADRFPIISRPTPSLTVIGGFSGMGFAISPAVGEIAAVMAVGGEPEADLAQFDPARLATTARA